MMYDIYDWDESILDWVWTGSDNGTIHFRPEEGHFGDDDTMSFWLSQHHSSGGKLDKEHFVDKDKIINTELVKFKGIKMYISLEESYSIMLKHTIFKINGQIMTKEEKIEYYEKKVRLK